MSWDENVMPDLLARLREVSDFSDMTHNDCVFDHLEGVAQSRNQVVPFESERETLRYQIESLSEQNRSLQRDLETSNKKNVELQRSLLNAVRVKDTMTLKIRTLETGKSTIEKDLQATKLKLQKSLEENKKVKDDLKNADNRATSLTNAIDSERGKCIQNAEEYKKDKKDMNNIIKDLRISLQIANDGISKRYNDWRDVQREAVELKTTVKNALNRVKELEGSLQEANNMIKELQTSFNGDDDQQKLLVTVRRNQELDIKVREGEKENMNLLLSLNRTQEILSSVSTYIDRIAGKGHDRKYPVDEKKRDRNARDYINFNEKTELLVQRFQSLNEDLVKSNILENIIYKNFIDAFNNAIQGLCTPHRLLQGKCKLYETYIKKDPIFESLIWTVKELTITAFAHFKMIQPTQQPILASFRNFDLQIHREFENILCIFQGIEQKRTLNAVSVQGYGVHVFWLLTKQERKKTLQVLKEAG
jgi:hypothetical protein